MTDSSDDGGVSASSNVFNSDHPSASEEETLPRRRLEPDTLETISNGELLRRHPHIHVPFYEVYPFRLSDEKEYGLLELMPSTPIAKLSKEILVKRLHKVEDFDSGV